MNKISLLIAVAMVSLSCSMYADLPKQIDIAEKVIEKAVEQVKEAKEKKITR